SRRITGMLSAPHRPGCGHFGFSAAPLKFPRSWDSRLTRPLRRSLSSRHCCAAERWFLPLKSGSTPVAKIEYREKTNAQAALHRGKRKDPPHARADRVGQAHRRARSARGQPDDAQPARHRVGRVLEQAALSGRTSAQAQGNQGVLPHKLKEMCSIKISVAHQCGYCSTVRSTVATAEGLTEDMTRDLFVYSGNTRCRERDEAALHYADLYKQGEHAIDKDEVYADLAKHFTDEDIIELGLFCAEVDGVGKFVKSLNVLSWEEACELNPKLNADATPVAAE